MSANRVGMGSTLIDAQMHQLEQQLDQMEMLVHQYHVIQQQAHDLFEQVLIERQRQYPASTTQLANRGRHLERRNGEIGNNGLYGDRIPGSAAVPSAAHGGGFNGEQARGGAVVQASASLIGNRETDGGRGLDDRGSCDGRGDRGGGGRGSAQDSDPASAGGVDSEDP
ncbi:unnamed protein product [Zymoseptoria tritici ST99CH_1A5]|uniref:Uncharacterized protein n=2 Tax=Zymoseptoria tritici TaxID=1047171 RepID=A0A1X7RZZ5_ZYMT9|nr:unnamed protein product [Zymoseptoria tritici ST99CH_3D7]SMY26648.1 unnamed protein product [Zymoseptoria tritici ST99CH_1A5]